MNPLEQINSYKGGIVSLIQLVESVEEPLGILSWCYYIISFSFWQTIILIDFWSIAPFEELAISFICPWQRRQPFLKRDFLFCDHAFQFFGIKCLSFSEMMMKVKDGNNFFSKLLLFKK